jgi:uncharacterized protein
MEYTKGSVGRIFLLKFSDGDDFLNELKKFAKKEKLKAGLIVFLGALLKGELVTGPKRPRIPPQPNWVKFSSAWETLGIGTVFQGREGHHIHIHSSLGKKKKALTGCIRKGSRVFLVVEAVVFELKGVQACKDIDPETGLGMLRILRLRTGNPRAKKTKKMFANRF